jgi:hypothetical protein
MVLAFGREALAPGTWWRTGEAVVLDSPPSTRARLPWARFLRWSVRRHARNTSSGYDFRTDPFFFFPNAKKCLDAPSQFEHSFYVRPMELIKTCFQQILPETPFFSRHAHAPFPTSLLLGSHTPNNHRDRHGGRRPPPDGPQTMGVPLLRLSPSQDLRSSWQGPAPPKVVRIPIQVLESYDFMTLQHHVDPNPTMNPNLVESMLSPDPNHRILYNIAKSRSYLWTLPILNN